MSDRDDAPAAPTAPLATNRFALESDEQFAATLEGFRQELAPRTIQESVYVDLALLALQRLRTSARKETGDSSTDPKWLRFQSMAERSLNNALNRLNKLRREAARAAKAAPPPPEARVEPPPPPAPIPVSVPEPARPAETTTPAAPKQATEPVKTGSSVLDLLQQTIDPATRAEFLAGVRDDVLFWLAEGCAEDDILALVPLLTLDDIRAFQASAAIPGDRTSTAA